MNKYFHRQIQLWGEKTQESLQSKSIAIVGSGGLGSSLAIVLGASGIGKVYCIDFDKVEVHNIHRQIAFKTDDEDKYKCEVISELLKSRCDYVEPIPVISTFESFCEQDIQVDLLIDATDNLHVRQEIDNHARKTGTPWLYGSAEEWNGQVCFFEKSDFSAFKITDKQPAGIAAPIVMHIASLQANLALRYLAGLSVKKDLLYYLYIDEEGELITQKFSMPKASCNSDS